jgi:hypothetical protein
MSKVLSVVREVLKEEGAAFEEQGDDSLSVELEGDFGIWSSDIRVIEVPEYGLLAVTSFCDGITVPVELRGKVGELLHRANYEGILVGHFELDYDGGEVRFRTSLAYGEPDEVTINLVRHLINENWAETDTMLPLLARVLQGEEVSHVLATRADEE